MNHKDTQLLFVYNADTGRWNKYMDIMHKLISPATYPCQLCAITHGTFRVHEAWQEFRQKPPLPMRFLHRDEWQEEFGRSDALPAIFIQDDEGLRLFLGPEQMHDIDLEQLKAMVQQYAACGEVPVA